MPQQTWMMAEDLESLLADAPLHIGARNLVGFLPRFLRLWRSETRLWRNGIPPSDMASKLYLCSRRWCAMLPGLFTDTSFYNFFIFRAPLPQFVEFLRSLPKADKLRPLQLSLTLVLIVCVRNFLLRMAFEVLLTVLCVVLIFFALLRTPHTAALDVDEDVHQNDMATSKETTEVSEELLSEGESESLSPPRFFDGKIIDSPPSLRQKLDHMLKHSVDAPLSSEVPPVSRNSSSSTATVSMLQRAELFHHHVSRQASQSGAGLKQLPETKWGRCARADCGYALSPHLYQSGPHGGEIRLLCSRFWKVNDGKRMCYFSKPCPADRWCDLPRHLRQKHGELPAALRRHGNR